MDAIFESESLSVTYSVAFLLFSLLLMKKNKQAYYDTF